MSKDFLLKWVEPKPALPKERQRFGNRELFALILPILVEQLLTMLVGIADTLMVSYAGEAAVSGVSLVNQLNNVFIFVFGAVTSGTGSLQQCGGTVPQYGKDKSDYEHFHCYESNQCHWQCHRYICSSGGGCRRCSAFSGFKNFCCRDYADIVF